VIGLERLLQIVITPALWGISSYRNPFA